LFRISDAQSIIVGPETRRKSAKIYYNPYQKYPAKEKCTQRKSAIVEITPSTDRTLEPVKDGAPLNTGDALAELLLSVVGPEPVPASAPAPAAVGEETAPGENFTVAEWTPVKIDGEAELIRVRVMLGRLERWPAWLPAETLEVKLEPEPVEPSPSASPGAVVVTAVLMGTEVVPATTVSVVVCVV
jgi:hypothetical protein